MYKSKINLEMYMNVGCTTKVVQIRSFRTEKKKEGVRGE